MERMAVIDIGTNSIRLCIAEVIGASGLQVRHKSILTTRIGEGVHQTSRLSAAGMERTLEGLGRFVDMAKSFGAESVFCFATSAVRDAVNRDDFLSMVNHNLGLSIEILSGEEEAAVTYQGAVSSFKGRGTVALIDIGGGSTEVIAGERGKLSLTVSMNVGAVRAMDAYPLGDPIDEGLFQSMRSWIRSQFQQSLIKEKVSKITAWVGTGGTITSLAAIDQKMEEYNAEKIQGYSFNLQKVEELLDFLRELSLQERKKVKGLQAQRADIIVAGTLILYELMSLYGIQWINVSDRDNMEGFLLKKLLEKS